MTIDEQNKALRDLDEKWKATIEICAHLILTNKTAIVTLPNGTKLKI